MQIETKRNNISNSISSYTKILDNTNIPNINFQQLSAQQQQSRHSSSNNQVHSFINEGGKDQNSSHYSKSMIEENMNKKNFLPTDGINDSNITTLNLKKLYEFYDDPHVLSKSLLESNNRSNNKQNQDISRSYQLKNNGNYLQVQGHSQSVQVMMPDSHRFDQSGSSNPNFDETSHFTSNQTPLSEIDRQSQSYKKDVINTTRTGFSSGSLNGVNSIIGNGLISRSNRSNNGSIIINPNQLSTNTSFAKNKSISRFQEASSDYQKLSNNQSIMLPLTHDRQRNSPTLHSQSYIQLNANDNSYLTVNTSSNDPKRFRKLTLHNYKNYEHQIKGQLDPLMSGLEQSVKDSDIGISNDKLSSSPNFSNLSQIKMDHTSADINKNRSNISNYLKPEEILQASRKSYGISVGSNNNINVIQKNKNHKNSKSLLNKEDSNSPSREQRVKSTRYGNEPKLISKTNSKSQLNQNYLQQPKLENEKYDNPKKLHPNYSNKANVLSNSPINDLYSNILLNSNNMIGNNNLFNVPKSLQNLDLDYINYQERINQGSNRNSSANILNAKSINPKDYQLVFDEHEIPSLDKSTPIKRAHHSSISDNLELETFNSFNLNLNLKNIISDSIHQNNNSISQNPLLSDNYRKVEGSKSSRNPIIYSGQKNKIIDLENHHKMNSSHEFLNKNIMEIASLHNEVFSHLLGKNAGLQKKLQNSTQKGLISSPDKPGQNLNFQNSGAKEIRMEPLDPRSRGSLESEFSGLIRLESNKQSGGSTKLFNEYNESKYNLPLKIESSKKSPIEGGSETNKNLDKLSEKKFEFKVSYMYDLKGHKNSITALVKDNVLNLLWSSGLDHNLKVYLLFGLIN